MRSAMRARTRIVDTVPDGCRNQAEAAGPDGVIDIFS